MNKPDRFPHDDADLESGRTGLRALVTGASSPLGARVLEALLEDPRYSEVWCGVHRNAPPVSHPKIRLVPLALDEELAADAVPGPLDLVVHFAGLTHARDEERYWEVNHRGTVRLAKLARMRGCRRFVYVSSRCATPGSGAYGESKLAAERELLALDWDSLLIIRPAEIYGGGGKEGVDRFIELAARVHMVPMLFGHRNLRLSPMHADDFVAATADLLRDLPRGVQIVELCGPESLTGTALAERIARRYRALPIPLWWPALQLGLRALAVVGLRLATPDQTRRLIGEKTATRSSGSTALQRPMRLFLRD